MSLSLPVSQPVLVFTLLLLIILVAPPIAYRLRAPNIVVLILAGVLVGPYGLGILQRDATMVLFGAVGLLYIFMLAGLELDLKEFQRNRNRSLTFGLLTFSIPQTVGTLAGLFVLGFSPASSILLASMFASHTLLTYPIVSRLGLSRNQAVTVAVGGTMVTDTLALLVLAVIIGAANGVLSLGFLLQLLLAFAVLAGLVLWGYPRFGGWFFRHEPIDGSAKFVFVLAMTFLAGALAVFAGLEPIIGAFLAGLALNRLIPSSSTLMNRLEFVGNTLFVPIFLISVGMLVDLRVLWQGGEALLVAVVMIVVAMSTKWAAAYLTQRIYGYTSNEGRLIFGLSNSQAAATLAAVLVGYSVGLLNDAVLNGAVLMILVTCLVSSVVTERAARLAVLSEAASTPEPSDLPQRILVPLSNPATIEPLLDLAIMIKTPKSAEPIYPLMVVPDDETARSRIVETRRLLEQAMRLAAAADSAAEMVIRIDMNPARGIVKAVKELGISEIVLGWNANVTPSARFFGSVLDHVLERTEETVVVARCSHSLSLTRAIIVLAPALAEREMGFVRWVALVDRLASQVGARMLVLAPPDTLTQIKAVLARLKASAEATFEPIDPQTQLSEAWRRVTSDDLLVVVSARTGAISYHKALDDIPRSLAQEVVDASFIVIYPEAPEGSKSSEIGHFDVI
jgi:Kef-type K+ transport system membrane component KefB